MTPPACNACGGSLLPAEGVVPLLRCACGREVPDERAPTRKPRCHVGTHGPYRYRGVSDRRRTCVACGEEWRSSSMGGWVRTYEADAA